MADHIKQIFRRASTALLCCLSIGLTLLVLPAFKPEDVTVPKSTLQSVQTPKIFVSQTGTKAIDLSVLTFNVAGLPWPISSGRFGAMTMIGEEIQSIIDSGFPVDVVLIQEGFVSSTTSIADQLNFSNIVSGPNSASTNTEQSEPIARSQRKWWKGEAIGKWLGSGLYVFSAYPVVGVKRISFEEPACAGYDCLANKGAVLAQIVVPGLPDPVDIITTHLNSTHAAGVPQSETHRAHQLQVRRLAEFWNHATDPRHPTIMAGDFNVRDSHQRFVPFAKLFREAAFVKNSCEEFGGPTRCDIDVRPDAPWLTSQDLQAYRSGRRVQIIPLNARTVLHKPINGTALSDHVGYLVRYRLSWSPVRIAQANTPF